MLPSDLSDITELHGITTGILLFDGAEELDLAGPWEVFTMARQEGDTVVTIAEHDRPVRCAKGLRVLADHTFADAPALDVAARARRAGPPGEAKNPVLLDWIAVGRAGLHVGRRASARARSCSRPPDCSPGQRVTTHWALDRRSCADRRPTSTVLEDDPLRAATATSSPPAGVSAGIDMALWLLGQLTAVEHARRHPDAMEYDPAPPYAALT